ncbi:MAG: hypothetical protein AABX08_03525 [Nanoarchaeota archaeon]
MIIWLLNILDLIVALILIGAHFNILIYLVIPAIIYLVVKGIIFIKDPFSIIDIAIAVYLAILASGIKTFLTWIFVLYLLYKTIISFQI